MELDGKHTSILFVCSLVDWPWVREAYNELRRGNPVPEPEGADVEGTEIYQPNEKQLMFCLGELPFIMGQLMVFRRPALRAIGGVACAEGQLVDDMYIGKRVHEAGFRGPALLQLDRKLLARLPLAPTAKECSE